MKSTKPMPPEIQIILLKKRIDELEYALSIIFRLVGATTKGKKNV